MASYESDCLFTDDFAEFRGTERFQRNIRGLGALIVPGSLSLDYDLGEGRRPDGTVRSEWRFSAVLALPWLDGSPAVWVAGESGAVRALRRYFTQERQVDRRRLYASGYWQIGMTEDRHQLEKRKDKD